MAPEAPRLERPGGDSAALAAAHVIERCRLLASYSEEIGATTRTFLSSPMRDVHRAVGEWMAASGLKVRVDSAGNIRGLRDLSSPGAPRLLVGSHLDTVPRAGAFDGILGVVLGIAIVECLGQNELPLALEVIGFSEEEGIRFGVPFIGSRALVGTLDAALLERVDRDGVSVAEAIHRFGLDPANLPDAVASDTAIGYLEFHIEQGPVLDALDVPLGVVAAIAGATRGEVRFAGTASHAGTTPMPLRRDALAAAAEWIGRVERQAREWPGLVATVGRVEASPGAVNVIAGSCTCSLDVRHADDRERLRATTTLVDAAREIAARRAIDVSWQAHLEQPAAAMDAGLVAVLEEAVGRAAVPVHRMASGAGHDAMILAPRMPTAMLFIRSPGGLSHHPDESVLERDVAAALTVGLDCVKTLAGRIRG